MQFLPRSVSLTSGGVTDFCPIMGLGQLAATFLNIKVLATIPRRSPALRMASSIHILGRSVPPTLVAVKLQSRRCSKHLDSLSYELPRATRVFGHCARIRRDIVFARPLNTWRSTTGLPGVPMCVTETELLSGRHATPMGTGELWPL